ncbi:GMP synthase (glutamine-hydrolysing) [Roseimicrobium gellanilyticum]|uniref:GMP synthase (glutamine-hydrolyzing) n=1 Tax=Roseimicrobium gellanilyticum TaxID=748857 RepID=A0A366H8S2_9BACT|nr:glutamine-hydrolyzing GMP synthase [Roseimicrobium gellanilyticum]RBP38008.1 GMP synthase (glutamine-hydrolysing) [Roseimicrobium gellanilyticum]
MTTEGEVAVLDYGSQYSQLIVRRVRELGFVSHLYAPEKLGELKGPGAIILSGGPRSTSEKDAPDVDFEKLKAFGVPVLGVCYGMQLLNIKHGGTVKPGVTREYGPARLITGEPCTLFQGLSHDSQIWMSHSDTVQHLPEGTKVVATNQDSVPVALQWGEACYGIQFHPEVTHSHEGTKILENFLSLAKGKLAKFSITDFKNQMLEQIRKEVAGREVLCGVSGGVDSTVLAVLLHKAGIKQRCIFVDHGLLRKHEREDVVAQFAEVGVPIEVVDASAQFLGALKGVTDPEQKRKIIGNLFLDVFFGAADHVELLAQGTLYPDVIESATSGSIASKIKTHHNRVDRVMELKEAGRVIEPLAELFKDEVRALGAELGIPHRALWRHPFPGPGLAVRVPGEITEERLTSTREADAIFMEELRKSGWYEKTWQAYAALLPVKTVGVKGDERSYEQAISLRAVISEDAMTADWVELPYQVLRNTSNRILNSVKGVNRVLYDISTKPPASIEWE